MAEDRRTTGLCSVSPRIAGARPPSRSSAGWSPGPDREARRRSSRRARAHGSAADCSRAKALTIGPVEESEPTSSSSRRSAPIVKRCASRRRSASPAPRRRRRDAWSSASWPLDLRLELGVPGRQACRRSHGVEQGGIVQHRRIVDEDRDHLAIALDARDRRVLGTAREGRPAARPRRRRRPPSRPDRRSPGSGSPRMPPGHRASCRTGPRRARRR